MKRVFSFIMLFFIIQGIRAQEKVIPLYSGTAPGSESWTYTNQEYTIKGSPVDYNISSPTLSVYLPDPTIATGTGVIICPGGGFYVLGMQYEGTQVAKWLNQRGVAAFILKYRTGQSLTANPALELRKKMIDTDFAEKIRPLMPPAIADGRAAIKYVREHAAEYNISPSRIGIIGFSAGGTVAAASAFHYSAGNRPDFAVTVYAYVPPEILGQVADNEPPLFIVAATDDPLGLASDAVDLYSKITAAKHAAELHIYIKGGHGFGMKKQSLPTDTWIDRFGDWLAEEGFLTVVNLKPKFK